MGSCCTSESDKDKEVTMQRDAYNARGQYIDVLEELRRNPQQMKEVVKIVIRLQAFFRGALARKKVK
jgi:hypothetical protein